MNIADLVADEARHRYLMDAEFRARVENAVGVHMASSDIMSAIEKGYVSQMMMDFLVRPAVSIALVLEDRNKMEE